MSDILSKLTLEEKAALCSGDGWWHTKTVEREGLALPAVTLSDGPNGVRTADANLLPDGTSRDAVCFPSACATASSFDPALLRELGEALGEECQAIGVSILLGPAANIKRSPLCGRNFEYISEDPHVTGVAAAALIEGIQSRGVGTSMKHFAANNQEFCRLAVSADMDERTLREIYLAGFEYAVKNARPATLMCSYNRINGLHASKNPWLLTEVLRDEWGFEGFVMSDWGAVNDRVAALKAGLDLEMPEAAGGYTTQEIIDAVRDGGLDESVLDRAAERILKFVLSFERRAREMPYDAHNALAEKIAAQSAVLLKNDRAILPLAKNANVAFIGGFAEKPRFQGGGSANIKPQKVTSALDYTADAENITYAKGFEIEGDVYDGALAAEAIEAARNASAAVIFAGLPDSFESEGYDRRHMRLPDCQNRLIQAIADVQPNTVVVLHNGSPVEMPWAERVPAILEMYLGGQAVGAAAVRLLFGRDNPSGKLAETFPQKLEHNPSYLNFPGSEQHVSYAEGVFVGYRYYDKKNLPVLFPFGHGLSYTTFAYSNLHTDKTALADTDAFIVSFDVTNTGTRPGKEAAQLYVGAPSYGADARPIRELRGYAKLDLAPGETKTASFTLDKRAFAYWNAALGDWYAPTGTYEIAAASSSRDIRLTADIALTSTVLPPFEVTENTSGIELLRDPRTRAAARELFVNELKMSAEAVDGALTNAGWNNLELPVGTFAKPFKSQSGRDLIAELNALTK